MSQQVPDTRALCDWTAAELSRAFASHELSPVDAIRAVIARVEQREPHLCALYLYRPEAALKQARASEARWLKGAPLDPLDGLPITLKDNIATAGDPMPVGTAATPLIPMEAHSPVAARVHEAGMVMFAKTTMPDYGMLSSGLSSLHALARNPWDLSRTPGGSSSGAGSAAAAGYGPLHVGTDIGGSVRLPAAWCGIFGFKPSLGRIPIDPPYTGRTAGPMTRTVADSALLMRPLSRPDARDSMSLPWQGIAWGDFDAGVQKLRGLRIGLMLDAGCGLPVGLEVRAAVVAAARVFEAAGAHVEPMAPFMTPEMLSGMDHFWRMRSHMELAALSPTSRARVLEYIRHWADSAQALSGAEVFRAASQFHATRVAATRACAHYDFVISPTAPMTAPPAQWASPTNDPMRPLEHIGFTVPFNMSEQPAASIPCGLTGVGLPVGLQVAGQRFDDLGVLQVCQAYETLRGGFPLPKPAGSTQAIC